MEEQLKKAEEAESEDDTSSTSSSDGSSSSSEYGLKPGQKAQKAPKAKAKRKPKARSAGNQPQTDEGAPLANAVAPSESGSKEKSPGPDKAEKVLEKSNQILSSLQELSPVSMYQGSVKAKDIAACVSRGVDLASKCEGLHGEPALAEILPKLNQELNRVSQQQEMFLKLTDGKDVGQMLIQYKQDLMTVILGWKNEDIISFLGDMGRKLMDELISTAGVSKTFYDFISVNQSKWDGLGFASFHSAAHGEDGAVEKPELISCVAQAQHTVLNCFIDRFRSMGSNTEAMLQSIPASWFLPEMCRLGQLAWVFGCLDDLRKELFHKGHLEDH